MAAAVRGREGVLSFFGSEFHLASIPLGALLGGPVVLIGVYIIINNQAVSADD